MRSTFRVLFFLKRDKQKANGNMPIFCRITIDKQEARFGIKKDVHPSMWDVNAGKAAGRTSEAVEINSIIEQTRTALFNVYNEIKLSEALVTAEKVKNHFLGGTTKDHTLLKQFLCHNEDVERLIGISKSKATYQKYEVTRKHLTSFIKEKYNLSDISFKEINPLFLTDFEVYLLTTCGCNPNTTAKFMQFFKRIVIIAKNNGWIKADPFANYKIRLKKVDRGYLLQSEVEAIMAKKFPTKRLEQVRDIFVFSCFCGLAYIDVKKLRKESIRTSFDENLWIMGKREKTDVSFSIPLLDIPKKILEKYEGTLPDNRILPVPSNQKMNAYLKEIGALCGIDKDLSFHVARNSVQTPLSSNELNTAIQRTLAIAEGDYVRYFDLFSDAYFINNKDKRILASQRYAVLRACDTLVQSQTHTIKEVFEAYRSFETSTITHYNSFLRKLKEYRELGSTSCTHGRIGQSYEYKMNPYTNTLIFQLLCDPHKYGYRQITEWVNKQIYTFNQTIGSTFSTISKSSVAYTYVQNQNEINLYRNGIGQFNIDTRAYLPRIGALNAGSLVQMDGSPVQIFCWNHHSKWKTDGKKLMRLNLFVLRDACTGKITGFDMSESEDRYNVIEAMKLHVKVHGHLPAELVHDNFSATKTDEFKDLKQKLENKGVVVRATKVGNAQDKGEVERYFGTFQSSFQRLIDGYLGEGIKSKRKNGRISEEFIKKHQKDNGHYSYDEMQKIVAELIAIYNSTCVSDKYSKTPNELYRDDAKPYVKDVGMLDYAQLFWLNKTVSVNRSYIINEVRKQKHLYEIWENEHKLQLNGKKVRIYYDDKDASEIHVFTLDGEFVCTCSQKVEVHEAAVDRQEGEELTIIKHESHNNTLKRYIDKKAVERVQKAEQYIGTAYEAVIPYTMEKEKLNNAENNALINAYSDAKNLDFSKVKDYTPTTPDTPYHDKEKYSTNNNKRDKGAFTPESVLCYVLEEQ